jgi:hypothetical protein
MKMQYIELKIIPEKFLAIKTDKRIKSSEFINDCSKEMTELAFYIKSVQDKCSIHSYDQIMHTN